MHDKRAADNVAKEIVQVSAVEPNQVVRIVDETNAELVAAHVANLAEFAFFESVVFGSERRVERIQMAAREFGSTTTRRIAQRMNVPTVETLGQTLKNSLNRNRTRTRVLSESDRSSNLKTPSIHYLKQF